MQYTINGNQQRALCATLQNSAHNPSASLPPTPATALNHPASHALPLLRLSLAGAASGTCSHAHEASRSRQNHMPKPACKLDTSDSC